MDGVEWPRDSRATVVVRIAGRGKHDDLAVTRGWPAVDLQNYVQHFSVCHRRGTIGILLAAEKAWL